MVGGDARSSSVARACQASLYRSGETSRQSLAADARSGQVTIAATCLAVATSARLLWTPPSLPRRFRTSTLMSRVGRS
jgi:hypothetical protein